ncbi:transcriptional regulator [Halolactibacillus sp. JCM 19043]|uniref:transcriptional regulator n=1 Tax=Halolactibacillus sp. JCM 19043 TaxID=1460638 RepID=UPI001E53A880|nr:transcriptional regulator [Halolactibacillus sp. JCM 19043]
MQELATTKTTFKKIESEWFNYYRTLQEIKLLEEAILYPYDESDDDPTVVAGKNSVRNTTDPTADKVIRLTKHKQLNYLREITSAIETVYNALPKDRKRLVHERYWCKDNNKDWEYVANQCYVSKRQALRWRDEMVQATVEVLGWR